MAIADQTAPFSPANHERRGEVALPELLPEIDFGASWPARPSDARVCRVCGCWDRRACYQPDLGPCRWVRRDLCSHCVPRVKARRWRGRFFLLLISVLLFWTACAAVAWRDANADEPGPPASLTQVA